MAAKDIMTSDVITLNPAATVKKAGPRLRRSTVSPVMCGKKVLGIASRADLVAAVARGIPLSFHSPIYDL